MEKRKNNSSKLTETDPFYAEQNIAQIKKAQQQIADGETVKVSFENGDNKKEDFTRLERSRKGKPEITREGEIAVFNAIRSKAAEDGLMDMSLEEINAEIDAVRKCELF